MPIQFYSTAVNFVSMRIILVTILRGSVCLPKLKVYLLTYESVSCRKTDQMSNAVILPLPQDNHTAGTSLILSSLYPDDTDL
jgi:hypothetical protein